LSFLRIVHGIFMRTILTHLVLSIGLLSSFLFFAPAWALGAIAVGVTAGGIPENGIAVGTSTGYDQQSEANQRALKECRTFKGAPEAAKECKLNDKIGNNECVAVALDSEFKSSGLGIATARDNGAAQKQALADCKKSAGNNRAQFCKVTLSACDGE
jgi:hypothetical protein